MLYYSKIAATFFCYPTGSNIFGPSWLAPPWWHGWDVPQVCVAWGRRNRSKIWTLCQHSSEKGSNVWLVFLPELAVDTSVPVAYCFITLVAWDKCYAYWLVLKVYNRFRWCSTTYLYSMIIICMHRTKEPTSFWLSTLVKVQHPATAWRVVHKSPSFMVGCIYILIYYHLHTILMWTELLHSCILTCLHSTNCDYLPSHDRLPQQHFLGSEGVWQQHGGPCIHRIFPHRYDCNVLQNMLMLT